MVLLNPSRGVPVVNNRASHFRQRPRVDGILIDEMSFWDNLRQAMIEFRDTARVGLSKEGNLTLSRKAMSLTEPRVELAFEARWFRKARRRRHGGRHN